jgi:hypothetical protein
MSFVGRAAILLMINMLLLLALEGLASVIVVSYRGISQLRAVAERVHARHDPELGWVNIPNLSVPDMYGPGVSLRTNSQGFRNDRAFPKAVAAGRTRLICSGDSFTLGYGVSGQDTWCNALEVIDPRIEPVNMGQGGYGIDQAYLWYRRDGTKIDHDVHVFAFVADDFVRMRNDRFLGYPKPVLALDQGRLTVRSVPVPEPSALDRTRRSLDRIVGGFRISELFRRLVYGPARPPALIRVGGGEEGDPLRPVAEKVFESLRDFHAGRGSVLVLVYLPTEGADGAGRLSPWRSFARDAAARLGIPLIDLVPDLNSLSGREVETFFIKAGDLPYRGAEGHYTVRGNQFIARALYRRLSALAPVGLKLGTIK